MILGHLCNPELRTVQFVQGDDHVCWSFEKSGICTVSSMYEHLCTNISGPNLMQVWEGKMPLKTKIFVWLLFQNAVFTKE